MSLIDVKDIKLGFWIGAGFCLFGIVAGVIAHLIGK